MDAWSSPWNDDDVQNPPSTSKQIDKDDNPTPFAEPTAASFSSLNSFDASDPWSADVAAPVTEPISLPVKHIDEANVKEGDIDKLAAPDFPSRSQPSAAWGDFSKSGSDDAKDSPVASPQELARPLSDSQPQPQPTRQQSLSSYDPWTADGSSTWGSDLPSSSSALPTSLPGPQSSGWGADDNNDTRTSELERHLSSTRIGSPDSQADFYGTQDAEAIVDAGADQHSEASDPDVWAAEATSREEKARQLDREEIDKLKVDARKLIASINTDKDTQASFADPSLGEAAWTDLFGSQGTQREKLHHLQTPPSALMSASGVLRSDVMQSSPATLNQVRSSIAKTENRGVKLASADNNVIWQRGSRPVPKPDWLPDHRLGDADSLGLSNQGPGATVSPSNTTSGPGWMQTSSNDTRSSSGPSFLASFFKNRQASAASAAAATESVPSPATSQGNAGRSSFSSTEASPAMSTNASFEPYQDTAGSRYTDDPTGPDLMSLDTAAASTATAASKASVPSAAPAQGPGLLSRWRNSGLFKSSAKKQNPGWASASLRGDDLDWLDEQESSDSKASRYHYDDDADDSFASFQNTDAPPPPPPARAEAPSTTSSALNPFDSLFGPAVPTSLNSGASPTAASSARTSLSATRMSGDGGMMTINTNLGRANSLARKSAASPLQPPPQAQNKRISIAPPPRANAASPRIASPSAGTWQQQQQQQQQQAADPFADFLADAPSQPSSNASGAMRPPLTSTVHAPPKTNNGAGLTADDLLFFDSL